MRCIFCKEDSSSSISVEHIIPESLGNVEHILQPGIVCDKCNNYFATKIEKPLLESHYFLYARFENMIPSKKKRIPVVQGFHLKSRSVVEFETTSEGLRVVVNKNDVPRFLKTTVQGGVLYLPHPTKPEEDKIFSRFIGKVAIEAMAHRVWKIPDALDVDIIDHKGLDLLRNYVRYGDNNILWPIHQRELYPADALFFSEEENTYYDVPHEFTLLYTEKKELFLVLAIFGIEYTINIGGPELDGYIEWLQKNENNSPLYPEGVEFRFTRGMPPLIQKGSTFELCTYD